MTPKEIWLAMIAGKLVLTEDKFLWRLNAEGYIEWRSLGSSVWNKHNTEDAETASVVEE